MTCASPDLAILFAELPHTEVPAARVGPKDAAVRSTPVAVPNQASEPVSLTRKRGRPKGSKNGSSIRNRLIAGKARAMAQAAPVSSQAPPAMAQAPAAPQQGPAAQVLEQAPDVGHPKRKRGRPKGSRSVSKPSIVLPAKTAARDPTAARPAAAPAATPATAAGEPSTVTQPPRKRGRPKGSKNAPLGERPPVKGGMLGTAVLQGVKIELCDRSGTPVLAAVLGASEQDVLCLSLEDCSVVQPAWK